MSILFFLQGKASDCLIYYRFLKRLSKPGDALLLANTEGSDLSNRALKDCFDQIRFKRVRVIALLSEGARSAFTSKFMAIDILEPIDFFQFKNSFNLTITLFEGLNR